jgi:anaerobic magnesium-protoporphyrin IX monomethyl ester cyclase
MYTQLLKNVPEIDFIVIGEGEITFPELIKNFSTPENVKGIAYLKEGNVVTTEARPMLEDLNALPLPKWDLFEEDYKHVKRIHISSSRGCFFRCLFCSTSHFWKNQWRYRSPNHVVDELEAISKKFPGREISFSDDYFSGDNERVIKICDEILKRKLKLSWICDTRIDKLTEELIIKMKAAGCHMLGFGIESGSQKMMDTLRKGYKVNDVIKKMKMCHRLGMRTASLLMVGMPGETRADIETTKKFFDEVKKDNPHYNNDLQEVAVLWVFPGTPLYEKAKNEGFIDDSYWLTEKKAPYYTKEWDYDTLRSRASEIVWHHHRLLGWWFIMKYAIKNFIKNPRKFVKYSLERNYLKMFFKKGEK